MFSRRDLLLGGALAPSLRPAAAAQNSSSDVEARALGEIRDALKALHGLTASAEISEIRDRQRTHLKFNQKLPEFIDVGIRVWESLYNWHLENRVPLKVTRAGDGRAEMEVMMTTVVLRSDVADTQIGVPYDR